MEIDLGKSTNWRGTAFFSPSGNSRIKEGTASIVWFEGGKKKRTSDHWQNKTLLLHAYYFFCRFFLVLCKCRFYRFNYPSVCYMKPLFLAIFILSSVLFFFFFFPFTRLQNNDSNPLNIDKVYQSNVCAYPRPIIIADVSKQNILLFFCTLCRLPYE